MSGTVHARLLVALVLAGATLIVSAIIAGRHSVPTELYQPQPSGTK